MRTATAFMPDLSERLANRVQLSSDALAAYADATERAFGADVDYGQVVKFYEAEPIGPGRYSPPQAAVGLHFAHYNFVRLHSSIRMTPAMAAGVDARLWLLEELVDRTSN